jgi:uncharacterized protein with FMN-binding domain
MSKQSKPHSKPSAKATGRQPIDPLLAQRLEQLNTRRPGSPLPPPAAPTSHSTSTSTGAGSSRIPVQGTNAAQQQKLAAAAARSQAARAGAKPAGRRAKPARSAKAASLALSVVTTAGLAAMFANTQSSTDSVILTGGTVAAADTTVAAAPATTVVAGDTATTAPATTVVAAPAPAPATIADGTYVGGASQNRFGVVQVQAVYSGGQLVDVQILSYPNGDNRSVRINQRSLPTLISESLSAQGTNINGVSGATYTSRSYAASLQSAIDSAKAASGITG